MEFPILHRGGESLTIEESSGKSVARCASPEAARMLANACALLESLGYRSGYDGSWFKAGDRVELHPGTDLWVRGAKYATVLAIIDTRRDAVRVELDVVGTQNRFSGPADRFRKV